MSNDALLASTGDILVIDDDDGIRELIVEILTDEGYAVRSAANATLGLRAIEEKAPAFLLLDIMLPGTHGDKLLKQLRSAGYSFPIALITASRVSPAALAEMGSVVCVEKPFDIDDLLACVAQYAQPITGDSSV